MLASYAFLSGYL
ncbi:uncharacterized protein FFFS_15988 [Fusarium fujikuroi]|nr:uncharacterized protein FFFS_15988 [Fusarium fujikuroi]